MTVDEQSKLKKDLTAARDRQAHKGKAKAGVAHAGARIPKLLPLSWKEHRRLMS